MVNIAKIWKSLPSEPHWPIITMTCCLVAESRPTLCDPMDCSTPDFSVLHQLLELTQIHVHWVSDAIWLSYPLSSPSPPAFSLSQHQGLFKWVSSSRQVAKVLKLQLQHPYFSEYSGLISFRIDQFDHPAVQGTLKSPFQHHNSKSISSSSLSLLYGPTLTSIHD